MDGFQQTYKQIQSFGMSTESLTGDFPNRNIFPKWNRNFNVNIINNYFGQTQISPQSNTTATFSAGTASTLPKWAGGVYNPYDKCIYCSPVGNYDFILKINTVTDTSTITANSNSLGAVGGVVSRTGDTYLLIGGGAGTHYAILPYGGRPIIYLPIDTSFGTWNGGVLADNGIIYHAPSASEKILAIDTKDNTVRYLQFTNLNLSAVSKYFGAVLASTGMIYCIPRDATRVLKLNPFSETAEFIGPTLSGIIKWYHGVLANNGMIYGVPHNATTVLKINPFTDEVSTFGSAGAGTLKWWGGAVGLDGMIYCPPRDATTILKINPYNDTISTFGSLGTGLSKWAGATLAQNGKIYCIPNVETNVLTINSIATEEVDANFVTNNHINKF